MAIGFPDFLVNGTPYGNAIPGTTLAVLPRFTYKVAIELIPHFSPFTLTCDLRIYHGAELLYLFQIDSDRSLYAIADANYQVSLHYAGVGNAPFAQGSIYCWQYLVRFNPITGEREHIIDERPARIKA